MSTPPPPGRANSAPFAQITPGFYARAEALLDRLLDPTSAPRTEERDAWLARETGDDAQLRSCVEALLRAQDADAAFLDASALEVLARQAGAVATAGRAGATLVEGERIGEFRVRELIATGGMGEVYRAEDERLGREVAIKLLPESWADDAARLAAFHREARTVSGLNHPGIVTVHALVEHDGRTGLVTERVVGQTLRERLGAGALDWREAVAIVRQVADALSVAHDAGIVHCDLKPENVMLRDDGRAKVLDFGIARLVGPAREAAAIATETGAGSVPGTPAYMSPEQIRGRTLDGRSDLFSLGVLLYELVSARRPFGGESLVSTISAILEADPPAPGRPDSALPPALESVLVKMLAKDREARIGTARELMQALDAVQRGEQPPPVQATPRYRRGPLALAAAAIVLGVAVALVWLGGGPSTGPNLGAAASLVLLTDLENHTGEQVFDRTLGRALATALEQSPTIALFPQETVRRTLVAMGRDDKAPVSGEIAQAICERHGIATQVAGSISRLGERYVIALEATRSSSGEVIARELEEAERRETVLAALARAARALRSRLGETEQSIARHDLPVALATTPSLEAWRAFALGWDRSAAGAYYEAVPFFQRAIEHDPEFARAHAELAQAYDQQGDNATASTHAQRAFALREHVGEHERLFLEQLYYRLVVGDLDRTNEVLELWRARFPRDYAPLSNLALNYNLTGQHERGLEVAGEAVRLLPDDVDPYLGQANALLLLGRQQAARDALAVAAARGLVSVELRRDLALIDWLEGNPASITALRADYVGTAWEAPLLNAHAALLSASGQRRLESELVERAIALAQQPPLAGRFAFEATLRAAAYGDCAAAMALAERTLELADERWYTSGVAIAIALCGDPSRAQLLVEGIAKRYPQESLVVTAALPATLAIGALQRGEHARALQLLDTAARYEEGMFAAMWPQYLRGLVLLDRGDGAGAAQAFERVAARPGLLARSRFAPPQGLALLGLARARTQAGDIEAARAAYGRVLSAWASADPELPALRNALRERDQLDAVTPRRAAAAAR